MAYDLEKNIDLYLLKAENFSEDLAPNQKKYYAEVAEWLRKNSFRTAEEAVAAMKNTEYYEGAAAAKKADDENIHQMAKVFGSNADTKAVFGRIFSAYAQLMGNPQSEYRKEAAQEISAGLAELQAMGENVYNLAGDETYRDLAMATEAGMANFVKFIQTFNGSVYDDDVSDIAAEQDELAQWVRENRSLLMEVGKQEKWCDGCAAAVPSEAAGGYDYIAVKEVE